MAYTSVSTYYGLLCRTAFLILLYVEFLDLRTHVWGMRKLSRV